MTDTEGQLSSRIMTIIALRELKLTKLRREWGISDDYNNASAGKQFVVVLEAVVDGEPNALQSFGTIHEANRDLAWDPLNEYPRNPVELIDLDTGDRYVPNITATVQFLRPGEASTVDRVETARQLAWLLNEGRNVLVALNDLGINPEYVFSEDSYHALDDPQNDIVDFGWEDDTLVLLQRVDGVWEVRVTHRA